MIHVLGSASAVGSIIGGSLSINWLWGCGAGHSRDRRVMGYGTGSDFCGNTPGVGSIRACEGVLFKDQLAQAFVEDVRINLGCGDIGVAQ